MRRTIRATVSVLAASALLVGTQEVQSVAAKRPSASLSVVHKSINAGGKPQFRVAVSSAPRGSVAYLQRQFGTSRTWKSVLRVRRGGLVTAPKLSVGRYVYRVHVVRYGRTVVNSSSRAVFSFGIVKLRTLCNGRYNGGAYCYDQNETTQADGRVFTYNVGLGTRPLPDWTPNIQYRKTSCRSLNVYFTYKDDTGNAYLQVIQANSDAQVVGVGGGHVGIARFRLDGGPFNLNGADDSNSSYIVAYGYARCWTRSGQR